MEYRYRITGYYHTVSEDGTRSNKRFDEEVTAENSTPAMEKVLGRIFWEEQRENNLVGLDSIHYEVIRG